MGLLGLSKDSTYELDTVTEKPLVVDETTLTQSESGLSDRVYQDQTETSA